MNRNIVSRNDILERGRGITLGGRASESPAELSSAKTEGEDDGYTGRLLKYIPPDVIGAFIALEAIVSANDAVPQAGVIAWVIFGIILVATPLYLRRFGGVRRVKQIIVSTVAFVVWAIAYAGPPFSYLHWPSLYSAVLLGLYTFLIPLVDV